MKKKLSLWWEEFSKRGYIARRRLSGIFGNDSAAFLEQITIYYCGANFIPECVRAAHSVPVTFSYLINGEKEPPNAPEDSPWTQASMQLVGGGLRTGSPEIIPVVYITVSLHGKQPTSVPEYTSDQVPLVQNKNRTVRVVAGQFESANHPVVTGGAVTILDVVLTQGGNFSWHAPSQHQVFMYVLGGKVNFGKDDVFPACGVDTLVTAGGKEIYASAQCAGGRLLVIAFPRINVDYPIHAAYTNIELGNLDQVESKN